MTRPAYNTGTGFYVGADKKLYDPSNQQFIPRGVNRNHYDSGAAAGITKSRATAERFVTYWDNFITFGGTPTYISATQFSVTGDQTAFFYLNGRVRATVTAGTFAGTISTAVFTSLTTVTVTWDSGGLDSGLSAVAYGTRAADFVKQLYDECYSNGIAALPTIFTTSSAYGHAALTGSTSAADLTHAVDQWVGQATDWTGSYQGIPNERWMIINIANEWGPISTTWRDSYITAISRMRTAGYKHTLLIDSGNFGQDTTDIINYGQAVFDSDPQKNVIFSIHLYGNLTPAGAINGNNYVTNITKANPAVVTFSGPCTNVFTNGLQIIIAQVLGMTQVNSVDQNNIIYKAANVNCVNNTFELHDANDVAVDSTGYSAYVAPAFANTNGALGVYVGQTQAASVLQSLVNTGLPIIVGEFGPGRNIGSSPTMTWPGDVIRAAEALSVGWLAWAWDDNNLGGGTSSDFWFAFVYNNNVYNVTADLTTYGQDVVLGYPYSFQVANYPRANFTYSPGLQQTLRRGMSVEDEIKHLLRTRISEDDELLATASIAIVLGLHHGR
jgi:hypothetical protein